MPQATKAEYNAYMRYYMLARYYRRKAEAIEKLGGKCFGCGATEGLQFDHVSRKGKLLTIGKYLAGLSEVRFQQELKKCQLLCDECHQRKTCEELGRTYAKGSHGTVAAYRYCHCELCRAAKAESIREYRAKRRNEPP